MAIGHGSMRHARRDNLGGATGLTASEGPNGRYVHYTYGTAGGIDDTLSRVSAIKADNGSGSPGSTLASYGYIGDGRIVQEQYDQPQVKLTYVANGTGSSAGYSGLDRFGRVAWQRWVKTTDGSVLDRYFYGYDRDSNRKWRAERKSAGTPGGRDEAYVYDNLNRLTGAKRGILPGGQDDPDYKAPNPGDVNMDALVNSADDAVRVANWCPYGGNKGWAEADMDGDGDVDPTDLGIISKNWNNDGLTETLATAWSWTLDLTVNARTADRSPGRPRRR